MLTAGLELGELGHASAGVLCISCIIIFTRRAFIRTAMTTTSVVTSVPSSIIIYLSHGMTRSYHSTAARERKERCSRRQRICYNSGSAVTSLSVVCRGILATSLFSRNLCRLSAFGSCNNRVEGPARSRGHSKPVNLDSTSASGT